MAGGLVKYRHLSRKSSHRKALLKNLVTSLVEHESITTTWHKAKEAQRMAEKLITLAKKDTNASRSRAQTFLFHPFRHFPKLFGSLRDRYANRPGGYTRVLRIEPEKEDQAASAILELVDGPKDMRLALTARTIAHAKRKAEEQEREFEMNDMTAHNVMKVTRFRQGGEKDLDAMVEKFERMLDEGDEGVTVVKKRRVYPELQQSR
ncbi:hypothetical protein PRZ48_012056 [Zasmidium cellare]|uniref:Ribosomal protein L17 n=1 Tax=Zasmidium cellare TaxID=395010 RepID=A0ABR0E3S2_ZASCE|nr:hypothetical protein PRZ48_012056 [Zasmidium cellare]